MKARIRKPKVGFVIHRFPNDVRGGAELHCRRVAEQMATHWDIEVISTCARDYWTWENYYPQGVETIDGITSRRFPVDFPRDVTIFQKKSLEVLAGGAPRSEELEWMRLQGPYSTALCQYLETSVHDFDAFVFFTYLYCTTFFGLPLVADRAILVPTAEDAPPLRLSIYDELFRLPKWFLFNTPEEEQLLRRRFPKLALQGAVAGVGMDRPKRVNQAFRRDHRISGEYLLYVGRLEPAKGSDELLEYFTSYRKLHPKHDLKLVLIGDPVIPPAQHPDIVPLGLVPDEDKFGAIEEATLIVLPSSYESLSMVALEAWLMGKAVLANGRCEVVKRHCMRSNGGLWYENCQEFAEALQLLLLDPNLRVKMGKNGVRYVEANYKWQRIQNCYLEAFNAIVSSRVT
ncbi:glycosyltransferase family 4 protein [Candidatus Methylomirabilis sp.]|uniref:glycosyltransferase family 4 protein n=1 Tax=Candidatus Methylomirabilis sp. TaxID=2032687 RepID=UPI003076760D